MAESVRGQEPPARRALDEAFLDQERFDDFLDGITRLRQRRRDGLYADRSAAVVLGDIEEVAAVPGIEAGGIGFELEERGSGGRTVEPCWAGDPPGVAPP